MKVIEELQRNQYVMEDKEKNIISFQSYESLIAEIDKGTFTYYKINLYQDFDYSKTTSKYLHQFLVKYTQYGEEIWKFIKENDIKNSKNLQYGKYYISYYNYNL